MIAKNKTNKLNKVYSISYCQNHLPQLLMHIRKRYNPILF